MQWSQRKDLWVEVGQLLNPLLSRCRMLFTGMFVSPRGSYECDTVSDGA